MTIVHYNEDSCEFELIDSRTRAVIEDGYIDIQAAKAVAEMYNSEG